MHIVTCPAELIPEIVFFFPGPRDRRHPFFPQPPALRNRLMGVLTRLQGLDSPNQTLALLPVAPALLRQMGVQRIQARPQPLLQRLTDLSVHRPDPMPVGLHFSLQTNRPLPVHLSPVSGLKKLFELLKRDRFAGWTLLEDGKVPDDVVAAMEENRQIWEELSGATA